MMNFSDPNTLATAALSTIAVASILVPPITTLINNHHLKQMKFLEMRQADLENKQIHKHNVLENYLIALGKYISYPTNDHSFSLGETMYVASIYLPIKVSELTKELIGYKNSSFFELEKMKIADEITSIVREEIENTQIYEKQCR